MNLSWQRQLADAIVLAAKIREESYDREAADRAFHNCEFVDYSKFYKETIWQASFKSTKACNLDNIATEPIYLLLKYAWNDILDWADKVVREED